MATRLLLNDEVPANMSCSSAVESNRERIGFMIASIKILDEMTVNVRNTYLYAKSREIALVKIGPELFGVEYESKYTSIVRAIYSLRTNGVA